MYSAGHSWMKGKSCLHPWELSLTIPGHTNKISLKVTCLVEQAEHYNLPLGIIVNRCVAITKVRGVPIILINPTKQNIWLWQPLLAAELYTAEHHQVEHRANMERKGDDVNISFLSVVPNTIRVPLEQVEAICTDISPPSFIDEPTFGPKPNTQAADFDFEAEVQCLPFKLNLGDEPNMTHVQQGQFIGFIYDHPDVFSLHDEDLRLCDWIRHTIPMTEDRLVYLPHCTIPPHLQGEVHKCLDTWF